MYRPRCIVTLLLKDRGLVKTRKFQSPVYIGDPINAVRIYNKKQVDELMFLDIQASRSGIQYPLLKEIIQESIMPFSYGGGLSSLDQVKKVFDLGIEKVVLCSQIPRNPSIVTSIAHEYGTQSVSVCVNVDEKGRVIIYGSPIKKDLIEYVHQIQDLGAGEIVIQSIERDGEMKGYDIPLIRRVSRSVGIQVVALGGAGSLEDLRRGLIEGEASAVAAGSLFVFHGLFRSVLISYISRDGLNYLGQSYPGIVI